MFEKITSLPESKRILLEQLVRRLSHTPGVSAIVLGGSYASRTQHEASDMDIGLYYSPADPFSIADIQRIAEEISVKEKPTATGFYGWGAWVNGGAWIHTQQGKVDFIYRNVEQVQRTIAETHEGISQHDYDQQPSYGFYSVIYLAETQACIPLYDPKSIIAELKRSVEVYPPKLKQKLIADSLWSTEFTLIHARGFAEKGDIYNTVGCLTRAASNITQALFALNERYFMRDKKVMDVIAGFPILPPGYVQQINRILAHPGETAQELTESVQNLKHAWQSVVSLPEVEYQPQFQL